MSIADVIRESYARLLAFKKAEFSYPIQFVLPGRPVSGYPYNPEHTQWNILEQEIERNKLKSLKYVYMKTEDDAMHVKLVFFKVMRYSGAFVAGLEDLIEPYLTIVCSLTSKVISA